MNFVAITSCPTGIAHSQMAAENLETTAEEMGHEIHVEVQGAMGAQNELSADRIAEADAAIVASDTSVSLDRFEALPVVDATVKDGVNDAAGLIERAVKLAESDRTDTVETADEGEREVEEEEDDDAGARSVSDTEAERRRKGGDPSKGLFARLKRLFS